MKFKGHVRKKSVHVPNFICENLFHLKHKCYTIEKPVANSYKEVRYHV
jgi:hypothetical protein